MSAPELRSSNLTPILVTVAVVAAVSAGLWQGIATAVLVLAASALIGVLALLSASVRGLSGDTPLSLDEAVGLGAPSAEEEQKRAVLRALKDLEFERSVGKISEQDYHEYSARYREEARRLITRVDESLASAHELAERLLAERIAKSGLSSEAEREPAVKADAETDTDAQAQVESAPVAERPERSCAKCDTRNDADARFCKGCGTPLDAAASRNDASSLQGEETST